MLKALQDQLTQLSTTAESEFTQHFDELSEHRATPEEIARLKDLIFSLPYMLQQLKAWLDADGVPAELKRLYWHLLTYVYHGVDVLPEEDYGFWGYLDDAYFIGLAYANSLNEPALDSTNGFDQHLPEWLRLTETLLPKHTARLQQLFNRLVTQDMEGYQRLLADSTSGI